MDWPPRIGEVLPQVEDAFGVRERLAAYSLNALHEDGGPKAKGFARILGITIDSIDYLEHEIYRNIRSARVRSIRENPIRGINCVVEFPLRGVGHYSARTARLRTVWEFSSPDSSPRLVNAFLKP